MSRSTGPIVTVGAITWANAVILQPETNRGRSTFETSVRVAVATGIAAGGLALIEKGSPQLAVGIAYVALVTIVFTRVGGRRSPTENLLRWWQDS